MPASASHHRWICNKTPDDFLGSPHIMRYNGVRHEDEIMNCDITESIRKAAEVLRQAGAEEVYVFGSAATGEMDEYSDVDMAVAGLPAGVFFRAMGNASDALGRSLDLIDLDDGGLFVEYLMRKEKLHRVA